MPRFDSRVNRELYTFIVGRLSRYLGLSNEDNLETEDDLDQKVREDWKEPNNHTPKKKTNTIFLSGKEAFIKSRLDDNEDGEESYNITSLTIRTFQDAKEIGECFRLGNAVIINLTEMEDEEARRVVDFCSGLIFGLKGRIEKITHRVFLVSPSNIVIQK